MDHLRIALLVLTAGLICVEADPLPSSLPELVQTTTEATLSTDAATENASSSTPSETRPDTFDQFRDIHREESQPTFVAFHVQLGTKRSLAASGDLIKLTHFTGLKPGQVARGVPSFELFSGTFTAPWTGVYSFTALVNLEHSEQRSLVDQSSSGHVSVFICIRDDCEDKATLQSRTAAVSDISGVVVTGTLEVEQEQTVSVFIENLSGRAIIMDETTSFMGYFIHD